MFGLSVVGPSHVRRVIVIVNHIALDCRAGIHWVEAHKVLISSCSSKYILISKAMAGLLYNNRCQSGAFLAVHVLESTVHLFAGVSRESRGAEVC